MQGNLFEEGNEEKHILNNVQIIPLHIDEVAELKYSFLPTSFGEIMVASSKGRIHWVAFVDNWKDGLIQLSENFPRIKILEENRSEHKKVLPFFEKEESKTKLKVYPVATDFQHQVWTKLLQIPKGKTKTYGEIAQELNLPEGAARAVGTAIGKNAIAYLIPCHRVIQGNGKLAGYRWGLARKKAILLEEMKGLD